MGILSFIIFLPFLFKENTMAYKEVIDNKENNTLNAIDYLKDTNKIATIYEATNADFKIIEHTLEMPEKEKNESVSSQETGTSGFVSDGGISAQPTFWGSWNDPSVLD